MDEFIRRQVVRHRPSAATAAALGVGLALLGALVRLAIDPFVHGEVPYISFFPMLLAGALLAGGVAGMTCLAASTAIAMVFLIPPFGLASPRPSSVVFLVSGAMVVYVAAALRRTLIRLTEAAEQERVFTLELQHRVKNTLAVVQSLAAQTVRTSASLADFKREFSDRLIAVADAHNVLSEAGWRSVSLRSVAGRVLGPFGRTDRVRLDGPEVWLTADQAVNLALSLHELMTNACKHGALSNETGQVSLAWRYEHGGCVSLNWRETGGPPVSAPAREGFGRRLLTRGMSGEAVWRPALDLAPEGLSWRVVFEVQAEAGPQAQKVLDLPAARRA